MNRRSHRANASAEINRFCSLLLGGPVYRHPRNGKIARLPEATRELINTMIEDGMLYRDIIQKLNATGSLPYPISEMNLSNWRKGGYQDWLRAKEKAETKAFLMKTTDDRAQSAARPSQPSTLNPQPSTGFSTLFRARTNRAPTGPIVGQ